HEIALWAGVNCRGPMRGCDAAAERNPFCHYLQARDRSWVAVEFPSNQSWNHLALLHPCAFKYPVSGFGDDPISASIERGNGAGAHDQGFVRPFNWKRTHCSLFRFRQTTKATRSRDDSVLPAFRRSAKRRDKADSVSGEKQGIRSSVDRGFGRMV